MEVTSWEKAERRTIRGEVITEKPSSPTIKHLDIVAPIAEKD